MGPTWTPVKDEQGRTYYWNESTQETSWDPPDQASPEDDSDGFENDVTNLFCHLDKNADGVLSFEEFATWVTGVTSVTDETAKTYFDFADSGIICAMRPLRVDA